MGWLRISFLMLIIGGLYFAALNVDAPLLYLLSSLVLSFLILAWISSRNSVGKINCTRALPENTVFENQPIQIHYEIENNSKITRYAVEIQDPLHYFLFGNQIKDNLIGWIASLPVKKTIPLSFPYCFPQRGKYVLGPILVSSDYPFGIFTRKKTLQTFHDIRVYPEIIHLKDLPVLREYHESILIDPRIFIGQGNEFYGIREYRFGDPLRNIHWKGTARYQELMVREVQRNSEPGISICMDASARNQTGEGKESTFEYAVKIAASIAFYAQTKQYPIVFQTQSSMLLQSFTEILNYLSECRGNSEKPFYNTILNTLSVQRPYTILILIFSGIQQDLLSVLRLAKEQQCPLAIIWIREDTFTSKKLSNTEKEYAEFKDKLYALSSFVYEIKQGQSISDSLQSFPDLTHVYQS